MKRQDLDCIYPYVPEGKVRRRQERKRKSYRERERELERGFKVKKIMWDLGIFLM